VLRLKSHRKCILNNIQYSIFNYDLKFDLFINEKRRGFVAFYLKLSTRSSSGSEKLLQLHRFWLRFRNTSNCSISYFQILKRHSYTMYHCCCSMLLISAICYFTIFTHSFSEKCNLSYFTSKFILHSNIVNYRRCHSLHCKPCDSHLTHKKTTSAGPVT
jgi:hypothetical protein